MAVKFANNASSTLASSISDTDTTVTLVDASVFPSLSAEEWFPLTVVNGSGDMEIMRVTARAGETLTVERGQEGTTAVAFSSGAKCDLRITSGALADLAPTGGGGGVQKYTTTIGNGSATTFTITHDLGTKDIAIVLRANNPVSGVTYYPFRDFGGIFESSDGASTIIRVNRDFTSDTDNAIYLQCDGIFDENTSTITEVLPTNSITVTVIG